MRKRLINSNAGGGAIDWSQYNQPIQFGINIINFFSDNHGKFRVRSNDDPNNELDLYVESYNIITQKLSSDINRRFLYIYGLSPYYIIVSDEQQIPYGRYTPSMQVICIGSCGRHTSNDPDQAVTYRELIIGARSNSYNFSTDIEEVVGFDTSSLFSFYKYNEDTKVGSVSDIIPFCRDITIRSNQINFYFSI